MNTPKPNGQTTAHWRDAHTLESTLFEDIYFNTTNGLEESKYVFLKPNNIPNRFSDFEKDYFTILELGLGTGLNLLLVLHYFIQYIENNKHSNLKIRFVSVEKYPLSKQDIQRALTVFPQLKNELKQWLEHYPNLLGTETELKLHPRFGVIILPYDVQYSLEHCIKKNWSVDTIFLDGFAPTKNPEMWGSNVMKKLAYLANDQCSFSTFTAAGEVRRGLQRAGFTVLKQSGYGKKREMLFGHYKSKRVKNIPPWQTVFHCHPEPVSVKSQVAILGAGIAGLTSALTLLKRGIQVTLIEKESIASGASGNPAALAYPVIDKSISDMCEFSLNAYNCLLNQYNRRWKNEPSIEVAPIEILPDKKWSKLALRQAFQLPHLRQLLSDKDNEQRLYIDGLTLNPLDFCMYLLDICKTYTGFRYLEQCGTSALTTAKDSIEISNSCVQKLRCQHVVLTNSFDARHYYPELAEGTDIKFGQVSCLTGHLDTAKSLNHYMIPTKHSQVVIGASYLKQSPTDTELQRTNQEYKATFERVTQQSADILCTRVSARLTTIDRYPMIGSMPDFNACNKIYEDIHKGYKHDLYPKPKYINRVWLNIGYGSKGFTHAWWGANYLTQLITGDYIPGPHDLKVHPLRHLIRKLKKKNRH